MNKVCKKELRVRILLLISVVMYSVGMWGAPVYDFTPTDGGLVVNLKPGQQILLSTMVNGEEYFVCHYPGYTGGYFGYTNWDGNKGNFLKLVPQAADATEPASPSIWTIDEPVPFRHSSTGALYPIDGIAYTMWSTNPGGDSYTLLTSSGNSYKYQGDLTRETDNKNICNAIFVVPTNRSTVTTFDPNKTLGRDDADAQGRFNGEKGYGFLGLPYREVYWLDIPRGNGPYSYTNASVIGFNKTLSEITYSNGDGKAKPGQALYAFGNKDKHHATPRTIFRLYVLNDPLTSTCADSYYFAYDEQNYKQYNTDLAVTPAKYTTKKKTYTIDRLVCMERLGETEYYVSDYMNVPMSDSTYYYVGYQNKYCHTDQGDAFNSQFKQIDTLKIHYLGLKAPRGAYGQMMVDATQTGKQNLGVEFQPGGYFLQTNTGRNIRLVPNADYTVWTCEEMWHITAEYAALTIKATMFTGSEYDAQDPGADIPGWSVMVRGTDVPVVGGRNIIDCDGWARIHINSTEPNGHLEFVPANPDRHIHYDNNGCTGDTVADQYPMHGMTKVAARDARLVKGFTFRGWATSPDGDVLYNPGDSIDLAPGTTTLYAKATYTGTIHVALSFKKADGKRYFLTHPGTAAPRFSRARYIKDWTDAFQGMANAENVDDKYINTFKVLTHPDPCLECAADEVVLDPRREMRHGAVDSLLFYENFAPANEEYLGLYYTAPNTVLANNTWAGLFKSTGTSGRNGWPDYTVADVQNAKLSSTHYLGRDGGGKITRYERSNSSVPWIKYNAADNQFDGDASEENATVFQISRVRVADEHYVVIPDTTTAWTDTITYGIHFDEHIESPVWSKLIGKQLMAVAKFDDDTVYFHPNPKKIITEYQQMRLNANYRLEETFEYIRDKRVEDLGEVVSAEDKPTMNDRLEKNYFGRLITSGLNTPIDVIYNGEYIDIIDTIRITLRTLGPVKIKEYYGRWKEGAPGLHIRPDGSRYRDIIVRTKTAHHGAIETKLQLTPEYPVYNFSPLGGASKQLNFKLAKVLSRQLLDTEGNVLGDEILNSEDVTSSLHLVNTQCTLKAGDAYFTKGTVQDSCVNLTTKNANYSSRINYDTLLIESVATVEDVNYSVTGRVPLMQTTLEDAELIWSVSAGGNRYFIMAGEDGEGNKSLIYRRYELKGGTLYKKEDGMTELVKGAADSANIDTKYITPWEYTYVNQAAQQLTLHTNDPVNLDFIINGSSQPDVATIGAATLTYEYVNTFVNENADFEEQVKLQYGAKWLKFSVTADVPSLTLTENSEEASTFSWTYLQREHYLLNNGAYPDHDELVFGYNSTSSASVQTRYKGYYIYSMLLNNTLTYCGREDENDISDLVSADNEWKTDTTFTILRDSRFDPSASRLSRTTDANLTTIVTPSGASPRDIQYGGKYVNIVDTLDVRISLKKDAPRYRFKGDWSSFTSVDDAHLKIPLVRKTYHELPYDSLIFAVESDEHYFAFPPEVTEGVNDTHTFTLTADHRTGTNVVDVDNRVVSFIRGTEDDHTESMRIDDPAYTEVRLVEENGNTPDWCEITALGHNFITVKCNGNGIRSPRSAKLYIASLMEVSDKTRYMNFSIDVNQLSLFQYANNQNLIHSKGASGADLKDGVQQVHENKTILYYYNPSNTAQSTDQRVELPIRERNFYGWWRWYSLEEGKEDSDIPAARWQTAPTNTGKWNFPFRIIGDSVWVDENDLSKGKKLVTQGRYTVFHVPSNDYNARKDPPSKAPMLYPPQNKAVETYAVDLSVYYDNLPLSMKDINQVDIAKMDTMQQIIEPTLSLREIYELHPWTEMAERMENYKYALGAAYEGQRYLEDHVVRAPIGNRLLLTTEQRYSYDNLKKGGHSESLLGYYMKDDHWSDGGWNADRKDTMIWCGGWDADCLWYTYNPKTQTYDTCKYSITEANDFLDVPAHGSLSARQEADTVIYCLRARSQKTLTAGTGLDPDTVPVPGDYWFNICRYTVIYHSPDKYGPKLEGKNGKAILPNDEIEQNFEVLEKLDFDYNKPGTDYTVYPHPLPWADASYGFAYPKTASLPDNRPHNKTGQENLANMGEYNLINRIPSFGKFWHKMEQHGGAGKGYMIFCDGMSSAGQVAALELDTTLCEGQKLYFSAYVGNPGSEKDKTCPNFLFSVQGSLDGSAWEDITSYLTGDLAQSNKWYQIYFPIEMNKEYTNFRVRVYNMASDDNGNDFIIDDMCIFATKPPLMVYQANTECKSESDNDSLTHIVLRVDYQGFTEEIYSLGNEFYTVQDISKTNDTTFLKLEDGYDNEVIKGDTIYGMINLPNRHYTPAEGNDSIFPNLQDLVNKFERTFNEHEVDHSKPVFRKGYVFEHLDDSIRPVFYVIHSAKMAADNTYIIHMAGAYNQLLSNVCALTRKLKVKNRMVLTLNGDEMPEKTVQNMCANTLYDVSLHVKGTLLLDSVAPIEVTGSCYNDWLLYGDTAEASSRTRYGYTYDEIVKVMKILRASDLDYINENPNRFAHSLAVVNPGVMKDVQTEMHIEITNDVHPYTILSHLVNAGFLTLYQENMTVVTPVNDSVKYTIFPIPGTGSEVMQDLNVEVCPTPVQIVLKSSLGQGVPLIIGGLNRSEEESQYPIVVLADAEHANSDLAIPIDSLKMKPGGDAPDVAMRQIRFLSTNDPEFHEGVDNILLEPDRTWFLGEGGTGDENTGYYRNGNDTLVVMPGSNANYQMRDGYSYTFGIEMMTAAGSSGWGGLGKCPVGTIPFTISVVPKYLRWDPQTEDNRWNNPDNWIGITHSNTPIHATARFAPLSSCYVIIPPMTDGKPYPVLPASITSEDSIQQVGFQYNTCHSIRFLSGAALSQQQRLEYDSVIADLQMPYNKWALRSAPVEGLLSGDIFMSNKDLSWETHTWDVGEFDAAGRNHTTGNASFWLSLYSREAIRQSNTAAVLDTIATAAAEWSKVTNALTLALQPAQGWAVYSRTSSGNAAVVRLPKKDDIYYYYYKSGDKATDLYESGLRAKRAENAGEANKVGKMAFYPGKAATNQSYTLSNGVAATSFVFGNPTMGYIDIWGFIADNPGLTAEIHYLDTEGKWLPATGPTPGEDVLTNVARYLPPMHAIVLTKEGDADTSLEVILNTNRIVTDASQIERASAPKRTTAGEIRKGIMTVTAVNPASPRCTSRLLLGQGFDDAIIRGEDAMLTTINIDNFSMTNAPATPFNIYAVEGNSGLSIDLRDEIVNVPISFYNSDLPFEPNSYLWFTGVNNIDGDLVLYDALTDTERPILDGIRLEIETPETSHIKRYYIRRPGYVPGQSGENPVATGFTNLDGENTSAVKFIKNGHVFILRDGHVYSIYGQKIR